MDNRRREAICKALAFLHVWNEQLELMKVIILVVLAVYRRKRMRSHPNRYYTPGKPFPLFHRLQTVFGRDKATGGRAEHAVDAYKGPDTTVGADEGETESEPLAFDPTFEAPLDQPPPQTTPPPTTSAQVFGSAASSSNSAGGQQTKGKRKMRDIEMLERLADTFAVAIETSKANVDRLADAIEGTSGAKLGAELVNFGFPVHEIVRAAEKMGSKPQLLSVYWGLPPELKQAYVRSILGADI